MNICMPTKIENITDLHQAIAWLEESLNEARKAQAESKAATINFIRTTAYKLERSAFMDDPGTFKGVVFAIVHMMKEVVEDLEKGGKT